MLDAILKALAPLAQAINKQPWGSGYSLSCSVTAPYVLRCAGDPDPINIGGRINQHVLGWLVPTPGHDTIAFPLRDANGVALSNEPDDTCFSPAPRIVLDPKNMVCPFCGKALAL